MIGALLVTAAVALSVFLFVVGLRAFLTAETDRLLFRFPLPLILLPLSVGLTVLAAAAFGPVAPAILICCGGLTGFYAVVVVVRLVHRTYEAAVFGDPQLAKTYDKADAAERAGRLDEAAEIYRAALAEDPRETEARHRLAGLLRRQGNPAAAAAELRAVLETPHLEAGRVFALGIFLADLLAEAGLRQEAADHLAAMRERFAGKPEEERICSRLAALADGAAEPYAPDNLREPRAPP